jgi:capsular polysaccharide transport system permease protein
VTTPTRVRSPLVVTLAVWNALFLREALSRISRERIAWLWLLLEPVAHITFLMLVFTVLRVRHVGGIETAIWIMVGMLAFFTFRRPAQQAMHAIALGTPLYVYRQVKPVDTVLVRCGLEGFLMVVISALLFGATTLSGILVAPPADPLAVLAAFFGLWALGLGYSLIISVAGEILPELGHLFTMGLQPLYIFSGVMFPIVVVPEPYRDWLMLNPVAHGLEAARVGFAPLYRTASDVSLGYLYACAVVLIFFGLVLHRRFVKRLGAQ